MLRHNRRHPQVPLEDAPEASSAPDMDELLSRRVELNALARVWPRLDEDTRWLLEARYILDYSDSELAREMGVKPTSVRMALTRAREKGPGYAPAGAGENVIKGGEFYADRSDGLFAGVNLDPIR